MEKAGKEMVTPVTSKDGGTAPGVELPRPVGNVEKERHPALLQKICRYNTDLNSLIFDLVSESSFARTKSEIEHISSELGDELLGLISSKHEEFFRIVTSALTLETSVENAFRHLNNIVSQAQV